MLISWKFGNVLGTKKGKMVDTLLSIRKFLLLNYDHDDDLDHSSGPRHAMLYHRVTNIHLLPFLKINTKTHSVTWMVASKGSV